MRTIEYPWYHPSFPEYNTAQATAIPFLDKDVNLVISFATAAGKTVLAECAMAFHLANREDCRVAYVCPFKSLASEKFKAWTDEQQLGKYGLALWSSDSNDDGRDGRLIVSTLESFDMKTRSKAWKDWMASFDCVVFDECFTEDSEVITDIGPMKMGDILDANHPVKVASYNVLNGKIEFKNVVSKQKKLLHRMWYSIYYDGGCIQITSGQPVWVDGKGYVPANKLMVGDIIYGYKPHLPIVRGGDECYTGNIAWRWERIINWFGEKCKSFCRSVDCPKSPCRLEIRKIKKIGWDPTKGTVERWIRRTIVDLSNLQEKILRGKTAGLFQQKSFALWIKRMFRIVEAWCVSKENQGLSCCCDLMVEDNNNFFVNGILCHNSHIIGDESRGGAMEAAAMRLTDMNPRARIVFLSATMGNSGDLAKWVKSLNGKPTKCITSSWRPTKVRMEYHLAESRDEKLSKAVELATQSAFKKTLVFVHSKATGGNIVKSLRAAGVRAVFHNASLSSAKRRKIEEVFSNQTSGMNILVSTSTLGSGVNLA